MNTLLTIIAHRFSERRFQSAGKLLYYQAIILPHINHSLVVMNNHEPIQCTDTDTETDADTETDTGKDSPCLLLQT